MIKKNLMVGGDYKLMVKYEMSCCLNIGKPKAFFSLRVYGPRQSQGEKKKIKKRKVNKTNYIQLPS